jgi:hypothetical protein
MEGRVCVDEWSTDSFQNVLFGLGRYYKYLAGLMYEHHRGGGDVGEESGLDSGLPKKLVIVSHEFKRARFMELHLPAMGFPIERAEFVGIDPPWTGERRDEMVKGEMERGYRAWEDDAWGTGEFLSGKRKERGWNEDAFINEVLGDGWEGMVGTKWRKAFEEVVRGSTRERGVLPWVQSRSTTLL